MRDQNAQQLLATVMNWTDEESVRRYVPTLQLLADYKYDHYQRFSPGKRFVESLALWLNQFCQADRLVALNFVMERLIFVSEAEFSHLVQSAYPDVIVQRRIGLVAEELLMPIHHVGRITKHPRFQELGIKSLYLGLSDGARTNKLRRASNGEISNEQIWHAYELGPEKASDMAKELQRSLTAAGFHRARPKFNVVWLIDDFSGSGNTYIRPEKGGHGFKGKVKKVYEQLDLGQIVDQTHYEVFLLLYVATRQAIDHIEYWAERFTSERGFKPLRLEVLQVIERDISVRDYDQFGGILENDKYCDLKVADEHFLVGGTTDPRLGFAGCALPVVLSHNTPNNSLYILWGPETCSFFGLFPRMSRHREF
jgi:hypothetical protein